MRKTMKKRVMKKRVMKDPSTDQRTPERLGGPQPLTITN